MTTLYTYILTLVSLLTHTTLSSTSTPPFQQPWSTQQLNTHNASQWLSNHALSCATSIASLCVYNTPPSLFMVHDQHLFDFSHDADWSHITQSPRQPIRRRLRRRRRKSAKERDSDFEYQRQQQLLDERLEKVRLAKERKRGDPQKHLVRGDLKDGRISSRERWRRWYAAKLRKIERKFKRRERKEWMAHNSVLYRQLMARVRDIGNARRRCL